MKPRESRREADEEMRHIRGLVLIRAMLSERGADAEELRACDEVIADSRRRLAQPQRALAPRARAA